MLRGRAPLAYTTVPSCTDVVQPKPRAYEAVQKESVRTPHRMHHSSLWPRLECWPAD